MIIDAGADVRRLFIKLHKKLTCEKHEMIIDAGADVRRLKPTARAFADADTRTKLCNTMLCNKVQYIHYRY